MSDIIRALSAIERGDPSASEQLLPLVYAELRQLAAQRLSREAPGQTLQPTALVHEAYLRLVDRDGARQKWDGRGHFFSAAAESMRRILIERARQKMTAKRGGRLHRIDLDHFTAAGEADASELLMLDEALSDLERHDPVAAKLVKLRYFAGFSHQDAAEALGIGRRAADRLWALARAWLYQQIRNR